MKITRRWLQERKACYSSFNYVCKNGYIGLDSIDFLNKLIGNDRLSDANWLITRCMNKTQNVKYAIFAAEQVIDIYEKHYPNDNQPRKAIEATKAYLKNPCTKTKTKIATAHAVDVAHAAYTAHTAAIVAAAVDIAAAAANAAAHAAYAAAYADVAYTAAYAATAYNAAYAAAYAAVYTDAADAAAADAMRVKILEKGLETICKT